MKTEAIQWVDEQTAIRMLHNQYCKKVLQVYTRDEKRKKLPIRTKKIGKGIIYSATDIQRFINS